MIVPLVYVQFLHEVKLAGSLSKGWPYNNTTHRRIACELDTDLQVVRVLDMTPGDPMPVKLVPLTNVVFMAEEAAKPEERKTLV